MRHFRKDASWSEFPIRKSWGALTSQAGSTPAVATDHDTRYQAIFHAAAIGIFQCTMDGRVMDCNPAAEQLLGYSREELCGMHFRDFTHPEDVGLDLQLFQEMVEGKRDYYQIELRDSKKNGTYGWVRLTISLVRALDGTPEFAIGMTEDITERKRAEEQLRQAQKMEAIGRLVGGVAHDFNNLLTGVMLYCDLLMGGLEKGSRLRHHAEEIHMAAEHGAALIQQLLALARQQVVEPRVLSLNEIVSGMTDLLSRLIGENIELIPRLEHDLGKVKIDPAQVKQIVMNLVLNARDAMPEGGRITVETRNCDGSVWAGDGDHSSTRVALIVSDTGCGMDAETRSRLFEPFFTTKAPGRGNGLGLATVYSIVKQNSGCIELESELGRGTRVTILLPRAGEDAGLSGTIAETSPTGRETVLLVDDNLQVRNSAHRALTECGYHVLQAANAADALRLFKIHKDKIHLLVTDLAMPGMSGRELTRQLHATQPSLRALFMTGYESQSEVTSSEGPVMLFRKPFTGAALAQKVREILDRDPSPKAEKRL